MRSSMKVLFTQDTNGLSSMACSMSISAVAANRPENRYNPSFRNLAMDENKLLPLGNIGRSSNCGLGLILPPPVSLQLGQDQGTTNISVPFDVVDRVSDLNGWSLVSCQAVETPFLDQLNLGDDISPILPLPPSLDPVGSAVQRPNPPLLVAESAPLSAEDNNQVVTQDITSVTLNEDLLLQEDVKSILFSPVPGTPTIDIAEYGMSSCYLSDNAASVGEPCPTTGISNSTNSPNKCSSLFCDNAHFPIILSAIPIYNGNLRDDNFSPSMPPCHDGSRTRSFSYHAVVRSSLTCGHRRSHRIRRPVETSSPSMSPSPTNSPKLYRLPIHGKCGCEVQSPKGLSLGPAVLNAPTKTGLPTLGFICTHPKRRPNMQESIQTITQCSRWNSPPFRSHLALSPFGAFSQHMTQSDRATFHRPASIDV